LRGALPWIDQLLLVHGRKNDLERLVKPAQQFVLPLDGQRRGAEDQDAINRLPELHLLDEETGHDCLARTGIVGEQKAQPRLRQHFHVNRLDLVG
jgi:hypothetical protein